MLGIAFCALITRCFKAFLSQHLHGISLGDYYMHYFSPLKMDNMMLFLTIGYFVFAFVLCAYSIMVIFGVWRSAAEYDKSVWMRHIAKIMILVLVYGGLSFGL